MTKNHKACYSHFVYTISAAIVLIGLAVATLIGIIGVPIGVTVVIVMIGVAVVPFGVAAVIVLIGVTVVIPFGVAVVIVLIGVTVVIPFGVVAVVPFGVVVLIGDAVVVVALAPLYLMTGSERTNERMLLLPPRSVWMH